MSIVTLPNADSKFITGQPAYGTDVSGNVNAILSDYNGGITNANLSASAAVADTKLAQITTAGKVSGTAITGLASLPSGAGVVPIANLATGTPTGTKFIKDDGTLAVPTQPVLSSKIGTLTRDVSIVTGAVAYTGVGFQPKLLRFTAVLPNVDSGASWGTDDGTNHYCTYDSNVITAGSYNVDATKSIVLKAQDSVKITSGYVSALGADGFTITWTKTDAPTGTATVIWEAYA